MKKSLSLVLVLALLLSLIGGMTLTASAEEERAPVTIEMYNVAANYQGLQAGWYGQLIKEKFNIELNVIAPQVSGEGDALYQTRTAAGNLGDIIILDNKDLADCVKAGLVHDLTDVIGNYANLMEFDVQIKAFNETLENNEDLRIYAIPCQMTNTSPTTYSESVVYSSPMVPWDYYVEVGAPELKDLNDLLDLLAAMVGAHPTNANGDPCYGLSLWPDWDGDTIANINQLTPWYGLSEAGSLFIDSEGNTQTVIDDDGVYLKLLKFLFDANQRGLVDPDSGTQNWDSVHPKLENKQVYLMWYNWQRGFWNTTERSNNGDGFIYVPVKDMNFIQTGDSFFGDGRTWSVGSGVDDQKFERIMEFLDWIASPEGSNYIHNGIEGFNYIVNDEGTYTLTEEGEYALMSNLPVPEEWGGGGFQDGNHAINQCIASSIAINPLTGETYSKDYWSTYIEANQTTMTMEWSEKFGAADQVDYLEQNDMISVVPNVNLNLVSDTTDIALIRNQCSQLIKDYSWQMIFLDNEESFDAMWAQLKEQLEGFGFEELVAFDIEKYQVRTDARNAYMD